VGLGQQSDDGGRIFLMADPKSEGKAEGSFIPVGTLDRFAENSSNQRLQQIQDKQNSIQQQLNKLKQSNTSGQ
jgi:hypothetical protein